MPPTGNPGSAPAPVVVATEDRPLVTSGLTGFLRAPAPLISDAGGSILSNNGSNILSNHGGGIISNNGGGIISNNGGGIISNNGSGILSNNGGSLVVPTRTRYRLASVYADDAPLKDAYLYLTTPDEAFYQNPQGQTLSATTDATGAFQFAPSLDFPVGRSVVVNALLNDNLRMLGFLVPGEGSNALQVNLATTANTEFLRGAARAAGRDMASYDQAAFQAIADQTLLAMRSGEIETVQAVQDAAGSTVLVNRFDLRADQGQNLRNQLAVALSAVADPANAVLKALSDAWTSLLGARPTAITSLAGNGQFPSVSLGLATGDPRGPGGQSLQGKNLPLGFPTSVAVARRGDVFVAAYTPVGGSGHIRWFRPDGRVASVYLGNAFFALVRPLRLVVEREPIEPEAIGPGSPPGSLLVVDEADHTLVRVPILEGPLEELVPAMGIEDRYQYQPHWQQFFPGTGEYWDASVAAAGGWFPAYLAGENVAGGYAGPFVEHPAYAGLDVQSDHQLDEPKASAWRLEDEGPRVWAYPEGDVASTAPSPSRFAHLNQPGSVAVDAQGSIFIAELGNHRIRMIPSAAAVAAAPGGNLYGYRQPLDANADGIVEGFGAPVAMVAGCMYTIAGNPAWAPGDTVASVRGRWLGDYGGDGGPAQEAKFDQPYDLAIHNGSLYVVDFDNQRVRRIAPDGTISTVVGQPPGAQIIQSSDRFFQAGTAGDGGLATAAQLAFPRAIEVDAQGRLFIADTNSGRIRMVGTDGVIRTVAGRLQPLDGSQRADHQGDGEARDWADLSQVQDLALDPQGNLLLVELRQNRLRKLWRQWEP